VATDPCLCFLQTSSRPRHVDNSSFASRRGHGNQLSISDSSHHITETIGTLYGDDDDYQSSSDSRPLSFIAAPYGGEQITRQTSSEDHPLRLVRSHSDQSHDEGLTLPVTNGASKRKSQVPPIQMPTQRGNPSKSPKSPKSPMSLRDMRGEESSQFPMGNMEDPSDIAQELSNLQALRRMSMDVSNQQDPDLLPYQNMSLMAMPSIAPQGDDDEADPSRLLWVPAGVHPELAPTEFKNFLEKRVASIKRRSSDSSSSLSLEGLDRSNSTGLSRKKSMLSRQIDNVGGRGADGYMDGAERLERKKSTSQSGMATPEGFSLDELMNDPTKAVQKLTLESQGETTADDMPILPMAPGMGLRRSTRTTYRKGGSLKDRHGSGKLPFSKRIAARKAEEEGGDDLPVTEAMIEAPKGHGLQRVMSEPVGSGSENFSRPNRSVRKQQGFNRVPEYDDSQRGYQYPSEDTQTSMGIADTSVIEEEGPGEYEQSQYQARQFPERSSSQTAVTQPASQLDAPVEPPARSSRRPNYGQQADSPSQPLQQPQPPAPPQPQVALQQRQQQQQHPVRPPRNEQTVDDMAHQPSPLPGGGAGRTDSLTFIPTFPAPEEKKSEKKSKKDKGDSEGGSKAGWKWFKSDDKEKKKKDEESKKSKAKAFVDKAHDNVRLDVLQTSIDTVKQKGRESLLLDRENVDSKLDEERRKEGHRKSESKKEKDGLFANLFGGGKKKGDRDSTHKKSHSQRPPSPEPAPWRPLEPDVDYHWTRFPILEERAIYRMAHIKLANPRRALHSQVLLSNFMYAYLAKVQAMHPQIQVPQSPQQKRLQEEERKRREQEQQYLEQQQAQQSIEQYNFEYHRVRHLSSDHVCPISLLTMMKPQNQYGDSNMQQAGDYPDDAEVYDYEHGKDQYGGGGGGGGGYDRRQDDQDDMW
jgi:hypothetical protein